MRRAKYMYGRGAHLGSIVTIQHLHTIFSLKLLKELAEHIKASLPTTLPQHQPSMTTSSRHHFYSTHQRSRSAQRNSIDMSSPAEIQYMYIPNLVGKQILRVPVLPCESQTLKTTPALSLDTAPKMTTSYYSRETSPAVSVESVEEDE